MRTIQELEQSIARLSPEALAEFRCWFETFDAENWDKQLAGDAASGKLEDLAKQALEDFENGRCNDL